MLRPKLPLESAEDYARVFRALADPARVQIIRLLRDAGRDGLCVCDITANFLLEQPTISHHLKVLRDAHLVSARKDGLWVYYALEDERLKVVQSLWAELLQAAPE